MSLIFGDPNGMRDLATTMEHRAGRLRAIAERLNAEARHMQFRAPYAEVVRSRVTRNAARIEAVADALLGTASAVRQESFQVEWRIRDHNRRLEEARRAQLEEQRRLSQGGR